MKRRIVSLIVALCACQCALAQDVVRSYRTSVALDIGAEGQVIKATPADDLVLALVGPVQKTVGSWRFTPVMRDGKAVAARTYAAVLVELVQQSKDSYGVRVRYKSNGPRIHYSKAPLYPPEAIRARSMGTIVMALTVRPDGSFADIHKVRAKFSNGTVASFEKSIQHMIRHATAEPEQVDGQTVATHLEIPYVFNLKIFTSNRPVMSPSPEQRDEADEANPAAGVPVVLDSPVAPLEVGPRD